MRQACCRAVGFLDGTLCIGVRVYIMYTSADHVYLYIYIHMYVYIHIKDRDRHVYYTNR